MPEESLLPSERLDHHYGRADQRLGDRIMWRYVKQGTEPQPIHTGTVLAISAGKWILVREKWTFIPKWLNTDELNLCEKIVAEYGH